jgi:hypothetical protein
MNTTKIVINARNDKYGGFGLSNAAIRRYFEIKGQKVWLEVINSLYTQIWLVQPEDRVAKLPGFWLQHSIEACEEYNRKYSEQTFHVGNMDRTDPILVQVVEELGDHASGLSTRLIIKELPKGTLYRIRNEYDGYESIETADSVDWSVA